MKLKHIKGLLSQCDSNQIQEGFLKKEKEKMKSESKFYILRYF